MFNIWLCLDGARNYSMEMRSNVPISGESEELGKHHGQLNFGQKKWWTEVSTVLELIRIVELDIVTTAPVDENN